MSKGKKEAIGSTLKESTIPIKDEAKAIQEARNEVEKACDLIEECMQVNNISKQGLVSACASMITTILSQYQDPNHFYQILNMMDFLFKKRRKEDGIEE